MAQIERLPADPATSTDLNVQTPQRLPMPSPDHISHPQAQERAASAVLERTLPTLSTKQLRAFPFFKENRNIGHAFLLPEGHPLLKEPLAWKYMKAIRDGDTSIRSIGPWFKCQDCNNKYLEWGDPRGKVGRTNEQIGMKAISNGQFCMDIFRVKPSEPGKRPTPDKKPVMELVREVVLCHGCYKKIRQENAK